MSYFIIHHHKAIQVLKLIIKYVLLNTIVIVMNILVIYIHQTHFQKLDCLSICTSFASNNGQRPIYCNWNKNFLNEKLNFFLFLFWAII